MLKQVVSFILPVTVLVLVPLWIEKDMAIQTGFALYAGAVLALAGLTALALTVTAFVRRGRGTLAPWSPTQKLVITGLHAYVRNPMILGVFMALVGESFMTWSARILAWAIAFFIINHCYFVFSEEPGLEKRFGDEYRAYKRQVPRWVPRLTPFKPEVSR